MEDTDILKLYYHRNEQAISETKSKYGKQIYALAFRILRNREDSEECENDTYLGAWNAIPPASPRNLGAFLLRTVRNISISRARANHADKRGGSEVILSLNELEDCIPLPQYEESSHLAASLDHFLGTISKQERMVFVSRYWRCDTIDEIAREFGFGQSKVKMMLSRTRAKLRTFLKQEGYEYDQQ